ncbi:MAG: TrkH family potassium uptake protein, partial [Rhabdochlamydiaceae bacterium]
MNYTEISRVLSRYFLYLSAILSIPLTVAIIYELFLNEPGYFSTLAFLETIAVSLLCGLFFQWKGRKGKRPLYRKESILVVVLTWLLTAAVGSLPFLFTGVLKNPVDAYFESMSSLTTTGVTILYPKEYDRAGQEILTLVRHPLDPSLVYSFYGTIAPLKDPVTGKIVKTGIEALGKPLLFWRTFMEWLGGMGIVVLFIAVLPALAMGGKFLFENEIPGLSKEGMTPRIKETASLLWKIYLALTLTQTALLMFTNSSISFFDAITLSFSTISTGGFTVSNLGLQAFPSTSTYWIIALFMIFGSLNFTLYFYCLKGKIYRLYEPEFFLYLMILLGGCLLMSLNLWNTPHFGSASRFSLFDALQNGSFMAISAQTSTGFSFTSYDLWPFGCQLLMVILMFIGGMSGSTTGGIKVIRYFIVMKAIKNKIETLFRPE